MTVPPASATSGPSHIHQSHFLQLLYNSLPRSSHFSPMARPQSEKDKDHLFRLRAEVQSYMLAASPDPTNDHASSGFTPTAPGRSPAESGLGLGRTQSNQSVGSEGIRRKPSPVWNGDTDAVVGEMMETVGQVWGTTRDSLEKDVASIQRSGSLDSVRHGIIGPPDYRHSTTWVI